MPSPESGNVMILKDLNVWGDTDHRPDIRLCPVSKEKIENPMRACIAARHGTETPTELNVGDFYTCFSGGKDRKRTWTKAFENPQIAKGRAKNRNFCRSLMLHVTEASWRARKKRTTYPRPVHRC